VALLRLELIPGDDYLAAMPKSPFEPCIPTKGAKVPDRPQWIHEIKHDGYRLILQRDGKSVRLWKCE
jgi:ATP-dependent DNA ligase